MHKPQSYTKVAQQVAVGASQPIAAAATTAQDEPALKPCLGPASSTATPLHPRIAHELVNFSSGKLDAAKSKPILAPAQGALMTLRASKKVKKGEMLEALG